MHSSSVHCVNSAVWKTREILSLKSRSITTLVDNYRRIFLLRESFLDLLPKPFLKEIFSRLLNKGLLHDPLLQRVLDEKTTLLDFKSIVGFGDSSCAILANSLHKGGVKVLYFTELCPTASPHALASMFQGMYRLTTLEITRSPSFDDDVMIQVAQNCPCLKVLNVSRTGIGDEGLVSLGENSILLVALDVSYTNVSFRSIDKLICSPTAGTLKELKCRGSKISGREEILATVLGFKRLDDYSFTFQSNEEADWVLSRVTARLKNFTFNIPL